MLKTKMDRMRRIFCQFVVAKMGYPGAEVTRYLGVTTSSVNRLPIADEMPDLQKYL
jgi:hypothetical protein